MAEKDSKFSGNVSGEDLSRASRILKQKLGSDFNDISTAVSGSENAMKLFSMLSEKDLEKLNMLIKNPEIMEAVLSSPKARENLKKLLGGGEKNG